MDSIIINLKKLKILNFSGSQNILKNFSNFKPLKTLKYLRSLDLSNNYVSDGKIEAILNYLPRLDKLYLINSQKLSSECVLRLIRIPKNEGGLVLDHNQIEVGQTGHNRGLENEFRDTLMIPEKWNSKIKRLYLKGKDYSECFKKCKFPFQKNNQIFNSFQILRKFWKEKLHLWQYLSKKIKILF